MTSPFLKIKKVVEVGNRGNLVLILYVVFGGITTCLSCFYMERYGLSSAFGLSFLSIMTYSLILSIIISLFSVMIIPYIIIFFSGLNPGFEVTKSLFWSAFPLVIRQLFRFFFMVFFSAPIWSAGMAGFLTKDNLINKFMAGALQSVDVFYLFHFALMYKILKNDFLSKENFMVSVFIVAGTTILFRAFISLLVPFPILFP